MVGEPGQRGQRSDGIFVSGVAGVDDPGPIRIGGKVGDFGWRVNENA